MAQLFETTTIKGMRIRNRFVRSATVDNGAESGNVSANHLGLYTSLAEGRIGLIITGMICVHRPDHARPSQCSLADDGRIAGFRRLTTAVHELGGAIAAQLAHLGRERGKFLADGEGLAVGPSLVPGDPYCETTRYRALTGDEIREIVEAFGDAARRAREAGFDAVQLHGAHAFLLAQFLSPYANRRDDEWGGSVENRLRIHREIAENVRRKAGRDFPLLIKLGVQDGFSGGLELPDGVRAAKLLAEAGFDALEISQGLRGRPFEETEFRTGLDGPGREAYFRRWCASVKKEVRVPVMMVGGLRTIATMEEVIGNGEADYISLCRPFIREPDIVRVWEAGSRRQPKCISCNTCIAALKRGDWLHCPLERDESKQLREGA